MPAHSVVFSNDGTMVAAVFESEVRVWDMNTRTSIFQKGHRPFGASVSFSLNDTCLWVSVYNKGARLYDIQSGSLIRVIKPNKVSLFERK